LGAQIKTKDFVQNAETVEYANEILSMLFGKDPYRLLIHDFFSLWETRLLLKWDNDGSDSISFIFDQTGDVIWMEMIKSISALYRKQDRRLRTVDFGDKRRQLPLQAADIASYRTKQIWGNMSGKKNLKIKLEDWTITKNMPGIPRHVKDRVEESLGIDASTDFTT
jgi:hypothetical protein